MASQNPHYDAQYFEWQSSGGQSLADLERWKFAEFVGVSDVVMDFGCGDGRIVAGIACREHYGVEVNPVARAAAECRVKAYADADEIDPDVVCDVIISNHALEHVDHPLRQLEQFRMRLKPGGKAVLVVPSETWFWQRTYRPGDVNQHLYTWTPLTLGNLLTRAGFVVTRVDLLRHRFPPKPLMLSRLFPARLFHLCCSIWATLTGTRQIRIVAVKPAPHGS